MTESNRAWHLIDGKTGRRGLAVALCTAWLLAVTGPAIGQSFNEHLKAASTRIELTKKLNNAFPQGSRIWVAPFVEQTLRVSCQPVARNLQGDLRAALDDLRNDGLISRSFEFMADQTPGAAVMRGTWLREGETVRLELRLGDEVGGGVRTPLNMTLSVDAKMLADGDAAERCVSAFEEVEEYLQIRASVPVRESPSAVTRETPLAQPEAGEQVLVNARLRGGDDWYIVTVPSDRQQVGQEIGFARLRGYQELGSKVAEAPGQRSRGVRPSATFQPGQNFRDECPGCPPLVVLPVGSFNMGSPPVEAGRSDDEGPVREVRIQRPIAIGTHEVTFEEWDACQQVGACPEAQDIGWGRGRRPVINVSWADAKRYTDWLSKETKARYRLPSEAEWEYAARAGSTGYYWWGDAMSVHRANCRGCNGSEPDRQRTVEVGSLSTANPFRLVDVLGNVWEWVEDCWHRSYEGGPSDGSAWVEGGSCDRRMLRGGAYDYEPLSLRSANRNWAHQSGRGPAVGFRVVRELEP